MLIGRLLAPFSLKCIAPVSQIPVHFQPFDYGSVLDSLLPNQSYNVWKVLGGLGACVAGVQVQEPADCGGKGKGKYKNQPTEASSEQQPVYHGWAMAQCDQAAQWPVIPWPPPPPWRTAGGKQPASGSTDLVATLNARRAASGFQSVPGCTDLVVSNRGDPSGRKGKNKFSAQTQVDDSFRKWKEHKVELFPVNDKIEAVQFSGGRSAVLDASACSVCLSLYPTASCFVMADDEGNIPVLNSYEIEAAKNAIAEALGEQEKQGFQNLLKAQGLRNLKSYCYCCYGQLMHGDESYFLKNSNSGPVSILSSEWGNLRKRMYGRGQAVERRIVEYLWAKAMTNSSDEQMLKLSSVHRIMCEQPSTALASDFHIVLGGDVYILYTCPACWIAPIHPRYWLRATGIANQDVPGCTDGGGGKWHCSAQGCLKRWFWKTGGNKRILLLPEVKDDEGRFADLKMVVIGDTTREQEHTITLLKTAQLVTRVEVRGRSIPVGTQALIRALDELNEKAEKRIMSSSLPKVRIRSATKEEMVQKGLFPYSEWRSLSLSQPGIVYNALQASETTPVISDEDRQSVLDALVCFYNFEGNRPRNKGELRDAWVKVIQTQEAQRPIHFRSFL